MARSLYIASLEPLGGKSVVALGLMELLTRRVASVGYFRPVVPRLPDARIALITGRYDLQVPPEELYAYTAEQVQDLLAQGHADVVDQGILETFKALERRCDFVLIDGTDYTGPGAALEFDFNARVANNLGAPVLALVNGSARDIDQVVDAVRVARESLAAEGVALAVTMVNRVAADDLEAVTKALDAALPHHREPIYLLPEEPLLRMPTLAEVVRAVGGHQLLGSAADLDREVTATRVAAMSLPHFLDYVAEGALIITPGDRADVILGTLFSRMSSTYPNVAGLLLTGGLQPEPGVLRLIEGLAGIPLPVVTVDSDTYSAARDVLGVQAVIRPESERKVATAIALFDAHVDTGALSTLLSEVRSDRVTPLMFEYELLERARSHPKRIVLPEGTEPRILQAAEILLRRNVAELTLLGPHAEVRRQIATLGLDLGDVAILDPAATPLREDFAKAYFELRRHKGITLDAARDVVLDVSYFGTMMVHTGLVDGMVSGAAHTTQHTIRPAFEIIKTRPGTSLVSSVFLMCLADRVLVYGDCAINPDPTSEQLADIAIDAAGTARNFGIEPRVAMLSYSTGDSGKGAEVEKVRLATRLARERRPDLEIDGPIQYDAAVDASVAQAKMPGSSVAGRATVFIFPDLNTGNNTYKAVQRSAGAVAIGPVLQGLAKPVNDLSRGALVADVVNTVAITAIQAMAPSGGTALPPGAEAPGRARG